MISSFQLSSASAAVEYHADAFDISKTREAKFERVPSEWGGKGAELAGFTPGAPVREKDFAAALEGRIAGQQIAGGWKRTPDGTVEHHKPGLDFTFSPGKTVSIVALVGKDDRVVAAHNAAVATAMRYLEENGAQHRSGGKQVAAEGLLYSKFTHITSRPAGAELQQDPQLHTHVVILNAVQGKDGNWHALDNSKLLELRKGADEIYSKTLDMHLNTLGYRTEQGRSGPEIQGITKAQAAAFSTRAADIKTELVAQKIDPEQAHPRDKQQANFATRQPKEHTSRAELEKGWRSKALAVHLDLREIVPQPQLELPKVQSKEAGQHEVDRAVAVLVGRMERAREDVAALTDAWSHAVKTGQQAKAETLQGQLKEARFALAGRSEGQMRRDVVELVGKHRAEAQAPTADRERGSDRDARLAAYADKLSAGEVTVSKDKLSTALSAQKTEGRLHDNVGKLGVETEQQTDKRVAADRSIQAEARKLTSDRRQAAGKASFETKRATGKAAAVAKIEAGREKIAKERETRRPDDIIVGGLLKSSLVLKNPITVALVPAASARNAARYRKASFGEELAIRGTAAGKTALGALIKAAGATLSVAGKGANLLDAKTRDQTRAAIAGEAKELKAKHDVTRLSTLGYRANAAGDVYRAKATLTNAALMVASKTLDITQLSGTALGKAVQNELVRNISTKKVNAVEALAGKFVITAAKAIGHAAKATTKAFDNTRSAYLKHQIEKTVEPRREAFAGLIRAEAEHKAGRLDSAGVQVARDKLDTVLKATDKAHDKWLSHAEKLHDSGRMHSKALEFKSQAAESWKATAEAYRGGQADQRTVQRMLDLKSTRDLQKFERDVKTPSLTQTTGKEAKMDNANTMDRLITPKKDIERTPEKDLASNRETAERMKRQERDQETAAAERDTKRDSAVDRKQDRSKDRDRGMSR